MKQNQLTGVFSREHAISADMLALTFAKSKVVARMRPSKPSTLPTVFGLALSLGYLLCGLSFVVGLSSVAANPIAGHLNFPENPTIEPVANGFTDVNGSYKTDNKVPDYLLKPNDMESSHACKCPHENFKGIRVTGVTGATKRTRQLQSPAFGYDLGDTILLACNVTDDDRLQFNPKSELFSVYPSPNRTCQPDCTWSGPPPICFNRRSIPTMPYGEALVPKITSCSTGECYERTKKWKRIVNFNGNRSIAKKGFNRTIMFIFDFRRHIHLSFMTFKSIDSSGTILGEVEVQINVESRAVVQNLSEDSRFAMDSQYKNLTLEKGTTIINVSVYTREVFVRVSAQFFSNWNPELQFYNIPQIEMEERESEKCPVPPSIPNARMKISTDGMNLQYSCFPGFRLINPVTSKPSNGRISCHKGSEWFPYPFPVCHFGNLSSNLNGQSEILSDNTGTRAFKDSSHSHFTHTHHFTFSYGPVEFFNSAISSKTPHGKFVETDERFLVVAVCLVLIAFLAVVFIIFLVYLFRRFTQRNLEGIDNKIN